MITFHVLATKFIEWSKIHNAPRTAAIYEYNINDCLLFLGGRADIPANEVKPHLIEEWVDSHKTWGNNNKRLNHITIQRIFNWGEEKGHIESNPIRKLKKPPATRSERYMKPEDYDSILGMIKADDPFRDVVAFAWHSGCRPQELRNIEPRHVDLKEATITFPIIESKGKRKARVIYLHDITLEIITRLMGDRTEGKVFLNSHGNPYTRDNVCARMREISKIRGKRLPLYSSRHGFANRQLKKGTDHITVAALMGHADGSMVAKVYQHVSDDKEHLLKALQD